ncbi:hypothetical protein [Vibrio parahaemolyticus]|uniref:hypothetical protein n=1 Tax=Vibrio parahaemolyticus TaxID=670 RepID=UPI000B51CE64|nr:hypothetical protein [Vibrio parahaemolyticus]EGQ8036375.1 hypothetical protein [Vibrio parahaemolyticus]EGR9043545.1 hypothetical protein [Vibrio parahaemolyticus]EHH2497236.1 hypothetical protein [Vibrio parahaemolyticus]EID4329008.1 hypothetical protein [Vibrio parahaemolyticus]EJI1399480.1 hypothetical protein [Vibrio parahaemolyticus]
MACSSANPLGKIRRYLDLTQVKADEKCGLKPGAFVKRESGENLYWSTFVSTLNAFELDSYLVIECPNGDKLKIKLTENQNG